MDATLAGTATTSPVLRNVRQKVSATQRNTSGLARFQWAHGAPDFLQPSRSTTSTQGPASTGWRSTPYLTKPSPAEAAADPILSMQVGASRRRPQPPPNAPTAGSRATTSSSGPSSNIATQVAPPPVQNRALFHSDTMWLLRLPSSRETTCFPMQTNTNAGGAGFHISDKAILPAFIERLQDCTSYRGEAEGGMGPCFHHFAKPRGMGCDNLPPEGTTAIDVANAARASNCCKKRHFDIDVILFWIYVVSAANPAHSTTSLLTRDSSTSKIPCTYFARHGQCTRRQCQQGPSRRDHSVGQWRNMALAVVSKLSGQRHSMWGNYLRAAGLLPFDGEGQCYHPSISLDRV